MKSSRYVLDSYALLAYLQDEAAADRVEDLMAEAAAGDATLHMSLVNLGEIAYIVERRHGAVLCEKVLDKLPLLPLTLEGLTLERVKAAAHVKARYPIAYADAFAVALAQEMEATIVTGDPEFRQVESVVSVSWL